MERSEFALMAHLMRRAGFGASYDELVERTGKGYDATVEELLDPDAHGIAPVDTFTLYRYHPMNEVPGAPPYGTMNFLYYMLTTKRPLEEKMTLFWHMVFATGNSKIDNPTEMDRQIRMFREHGMGNYRDLLVRLAKDPAMIFWLDNNMSHKHAPNENWGRELLELFSMGQGNYSEDDVKMASRAFTGWTIKPKLPRAPYGRFLWEFEYKAEDHDDSEKEFLGRTGNFNGEDIIDIILEEPVTARFIARHLYNFFVADEVQVPSWNDEPPRNPEAVQAIADAFVSSNFDIRATLRFIFTSDFFKDEAIWFQKVKNPAEIIAGATRLVGDYQEPKPGVMHLALETGYQGQELINPPSVEGWHTGSEWIDTGALVRRVNFVSSLLGDADKPGVRSIIDRLAAKDSLTADELVDGCLELLGAIQLESGTRQQIVDHVAKDGAAQRGDTEAERSIFANRVTETLQLIAAAREYQFA